MAANSSSSPTLAGHGAHLDISSVGVALFGSDVDIKEGDAVKRPGASPRCPWATHCWAAWSRHRQPIDD
jgi:hypothetical protein